MSKRITEEQKWLIDKIKEEIHSHRDVKSDWRTGVYFDADAMMYLYNDKYMHYEAVQGLIESGVLNYVGRHRYQGIKMMRYELNQNHKLQ